jgi:hypothetical protein
MIINDDGDHFFMWLVMITVTDLKGMELKYANGKKYIQSGELVLDICLQNRNEKFEILVSKTIK